MERGLLAPAPPPRAPLALPLSARALSSAPGVGAGVPGTALPLVKAAGPVGPVALDAAARHLSRRPQAGPGIPGARDPAWRAPLPRSARPRPCYVPARPWAFVFPQTPWVIIL